jgi:hypothetical protein
MPPIVIAAGVAAAGSAIGSANSSRAARRVAQQQSDASQSQIAANNANRDYQYNLNAPTIDQGNQASSLYAGFVGAGGDPKASAAALDTFRGSTGYTDLQREGARSTNAAVFAGGLGQSGAALKSLQDRATQIANGSAQQYLGNLGNLASRGDQSRGLVAGIGSNTVNSNNQATQNAADATSNATLASAGNTNSLIQNLLNAGATAYGSSYRPKTPLIPQRPGNSTIYMPSNASFAGAR